MFIVIILVPAVLAAIFLYAVPTVGGKAGDGQPSIWRRLRGYRDAIRKKHRLHKEVIMAMVQRKVYKLGTTNNRTDGRGAKNKADLQILKFVTNACADIDAFYPSVKSMQSVIDSYCDRIEKIAVKYEANLCLLNNELVWITKQRIKIDRDLYTMLQCKTSAMAKVPVIEIDLCSTPQKPAPVLPIECPTVTFAMTDEESYFASMFEQLINNKFK